MPNHITNRITVDTQEEMDAILAKYRSKDSELDFNKICPMPPDVLDSLNSKGVAGQMPLWYRWCCDNWGTKWNNYNFSNMGEIITFQTAWSRVIPIVLAISKDFPKSDILYEYSDEDIGYQCGKLIAQNGKIVLHAEFEGGGEEAYKMAFELHPGIEEDYKLVNGKYQYVEE